MKRLSRTMLCFFIFTGLVLAGLLIPAGPVFADVKGLMVPALIYRDAQGPDDGRLQPGDEVSVQAHLTYFEWVESGDGVWVEDLQAKIKIVRRPATEDARVYLRVTSPGGEQERLLMERAGPHPDIEGTTMFRRRITVDERGEWVLQAIGFDREQAYGITTHLQVGEKAGQESGENGTAFSLSLASLMPVLAVVLAAAGWWQHRKRVTPEDSRTDEESDREPG